MSFPQTNNTESEYVCIIQDEFEYTKPIHVYANSHGRAAELAVERRVKEKNQLPIMPRMVSVKKIADDIFMWKMYKVTAILEPEYTSQPVQWEGENE